MRAKRQRKRKVSETAIVRVASETGLERKKPEEMDTWQDKEPDQLFELRETGRATYRGPVGLAFAIGINVEPIAEAFERLADQIEKDAKGKP